MSQPVNLFLKAQLSAFLGGITDYVSMILLTEKLKIPFQFSILISGIIGSSVNFYLNRAWAFRTSSAYEKPAKVQMVKFAILVLASISLKSAGTYMLYGILHIDYRIGRPMIDLMVSYGFNYPLMKRWIFSTKRVLN